MPTISDDSRSDQWLTWARELQAMAQTGLAYSQSPYDTERYNRLMVMAAEIVSLHSNLNTAEVLDTFYVSPGYATVKVDVRGAMIQEGKVLLVQERSDQQWCLPGGWADVGERPSEMVVREIREESGLQACPTHIVGVYDANRSEPMEFFHAYKIVFLCEIIGGSPQPSDETMAVDFFTFNHLPNLSMNRTNKQHLDDIQSFIERPHPNTVFD